MGYSVRTLEWVARLHQDGLLGEGDSVIELGSQDVMADPVSAMAMLGARLGRQCAEDTLVTPAVVYELMGKSTYRCIDTDGRHGALVMDLNCDLAATYGYTETFSLVTNAGTTEHVFDQATALANIHRLCAPGGVMLYIVPSQGWANHGYFDYEPCLFYDLAAANRYEVLSLELDVGLGPVDGWVEPYRHGQTDPGAVAAKHGAAVMLLVALRKTVDAPFERPFDSHYLEVNKLAEPYAEQERDAAMPSLHHGDLYPPWSAHRDIALLTGRELTGILWRRLLGKVRRKLRL